MKSFRQKYFEQYKARMVPDNSRKGYKMKYEYVGDFYSWALPQKDICRRKHIYIILTCISTLLFLISGTMQAKVNLSAPVAIAGLASLVSLLYEWIGVVRFALSKEEMTEQDSKEILQLLQASSMITALLHLFAACAGLVVLFRSGAESSSFIAVFCIAVSGAASLFLHQYNKMLSAVKCREPFITEDEMPFE